MNYSWEEGLIQTVGRGTMVCSVSRQHQHKLHLPITFLKPSLHTNLHNDAVYYQTQPQSKQYLKKIKNQLNFSISTSTLTWCLHKLLETKIGDKIIKVITVIRTFTEL